MFVQCNNVFLNYLQLVLAYSIQQRGAESHTADFSISLSAASRKCQTVCHALRCGLQCSGSNWAKKKTHTQAKNKQKEKTQCKGGTSIRATVFLLSNEPDPLSSRDHRPLGLFSSFKMTHIFTLCPLLYHFLSLGLCQKVPLHMAARFPVGHWKSTALTYEVQRQCSTPLNKHALAPT